MLSGRFVTSFEVSSVWRSAFSVWRTVASAVTVTASAALLELTEALERSRNVVCARQKVAERVVPLGIRLRLDLQAGSGVGRGHGRAGHRGAGLVGDGAGDRAVEGLRGRDGRRE
jgi:hypothetical protein